MDGQGTSSNQYQMGNLGQMQLMGASKSSVVPTSAAGPLGGVKCGKQQVLRATTNNKDMSEDHGKNPLTSFHVSVEKNTEKFQNINCDSCNNSSAQPFRRQLVAVRDPEDKFSEGEQEHESISGQPESGVTLGAFLGNQQQLRIGKLKAAQGLPK